MPARLRVKFDAKKKNEYNANSLAMYFLTGRLPFDLGNEGKRIGWGGRNGTCNRSFDLHLNIDIT